MSAVTVAILTPFIILLHPIFHSIIFTGIDPLSLFILSPIYKRLIFLGSLFVVASLGLLGYKRNKLLIATSFSLFILGIGMWYFSVQNYISMNDEHILKKSYFSKEQFEWKEFTDIVYEYNDEDKGDYTFTLVTGEKFIIKENELRTDGKSQIYNSAVANNIPFTERSK